MVNCPVLLLSRNVQEEINFAMRCVVNVESMYVDKQIEQFFPSHFLQAKVCKKFYSVWLCGWNRQSSLLSNIFSACM